MLVSEEKERVDIETGKVRVLGKTIEVGHVLIIGASKIEASISPENLKVTIYFPSIPRLDEQGDLVKVARSGAVYEVNTSGENVKIVEKPGELRLEGEVVSVKFEADDDQVTVKIPGKGKMRAQKLSIKGEGNVSVNIITQPITVGVFTLKTAKLRISKKGDVIVAEAVGTM